MGARLTMETLVQLRLAGRDDVLDRIEVILAAPDIDIDLFRAQMVSRSDEASHHGARLPDDLALKLSSQLRYVGYGGFVADVRDPRPAPGGRDRNTDRGYYRYSGPIDDPAHSRYVGLLSGEAGAVVENTLFGEVRLAGAFVFNQVGVLTGIGDVLAD